MALGKNGIKKNGTYKNGTSTSGIKSSRNATSNSQGRPDPEKWTVMVFMAAESVDGFAPLGKMAKDDLAEMEKVSSNDYVDIFVQLHEDRGVRRIHVGRNETKVPEGERPHEQGLALSCFVKWALQVAPPSPERRSMLVLWGHSYQFAVGQTPLPDGRIDALDFKKLSDVLQRLSYDSKMAGYHGKLVDIFGFDACDLSTVEVAVQLEPFADYLLASEMGIPLPGWPYDRILDRLHNPLDRPDDQKKPKRTMGPAELGSFAVRRYCEAYSSDRAATLTLLDLNKAAPVAQAVNRLAGALALVVGRGGDDKDAILGLFSRSQTDTDKPYIDVASLCLDLMRESDDSDVKDAAEKLGDLLITPNPVQPGGSQFGIGRPFVQEHGRNAARTAKLNGVSLYAPHVVPHDFEAAREAYEGFAFAKNSFWNQLVHNMARSV